MGAFFLFESEKKIDNEAVKRVFLAKGFKDVNVFHLKKMTLWLYKKQLIEDDNYIFFDNGNAIFATGTVIYKGKSYRESLRELLVDFIKDEISFEKLIGSFCLIFSSRIHDFCAR